jgi:general stress protein 26
MAKSTNGDAHEGMRKLRRLVRKVHVAMLTTVDEAGAIHSRPMATCQVETDGALWFFTSIDTQKVHDIQVDRHVSVTYTAPEDERYVSVTGTAQVVQDREKMRKLFEPELRAWFPRGLDEPNIALIRVDVAEVEYWDPRAGKLRDMLGRLRSALMRGPRYPARHGHIAIRGQAAQAAQAS